MPYVNEHSARLRDPKDFDGETFRRTKGGMLFNKIDCPPTIGIIWGKLKGEVDEKDPVLAQSLRFSVEAWTEEEAKNWLKENDVAYIIFEPAQKEKQNLEISKSALSFSIAPVSFLLESATAEKKASAKFSILANSGATIENHWYWGNLGIDLTGLQIGRQKKPVLREHDIEKVVGFSETIIKNEKGLQVEGACIESDEAKKVQAMAAQGFPWQASIYITPQKIERLGIGDIAQCNGFTVVGPGAIFRSSRLREISFCVLGADENTEANILAENGKITLQVEEVKKDMEIKDLTLSQVQEQRKDICDTLLAEGKKQARELVLSVIASIPEGMEKVGLQCLKDGFSAEQTKKRCLEGLQKVSPATPGPNEDKISVDLTSLSFAERAKWEWDNKAEVKNEFRDEKNYIAYRKAELAGLVKIK